MTAKHVLANMLATKQLQYDIKYLYINPIYIYINVVVILYIYTHGDVNMCVCARVCEALSMNLWSRACIILKLSLPASIKNCRLLYCSIVKHDINRNDHCALGKVYLNICIDLLTQSLCL